MNTTYRTKRRVSVSQVLFTICIGFLAGFFVVKGFTWFGKSTQSSEVGSSSSSAADPLHKSVTILCWVMTSPSTHHTRAQHVKNTWGRNCNRLIFMSTVEDVRLGTVALPIKQEGRDYLWAKTKASLLHLYKYHRNSADWFFKADDDTYAILPNMRLLLRNYNASEPVFLGIRFNSSGTVFASGGAGYVISRKTLQKVVQEGMNYSDKCRQDHGGYEDLELAKCLGKIGIPVTDTRDADGAMKFMPYMPNIHGDEDEMRQTKMSWFHDFTRNNPVPKGLAGCSPNAVTFHYVSPEEMYELDYFVNHLKIYGRERSVRPRISPTTPGEKKKRKITRQS